MTPATARLLLVEDDQTLSEIVSTLLKQEAYRVTLTRNGEDALRLAREERPDLILLDVLLPKMSGFEVCQRLRSDPATCLIPIILVTALGATKDKVTGFKLGADEYLSKPFESMELLARVERVLQRSREELAANPLTGLPGGVALEREIQRRLMDQEAFTVARADVSGLATFNRLYGYEKGDHVVRLIGMILRSAVVELGNNNDLVAHFGGDDFGFVSTSVRAEVVAARALENAETLLLMQYEEKDRTHDAVGEGAPVA
ncbi:MAG TPA: response regulator, partial [Elusimicrobiota bacterium]|nr:response regulator [Elusimicrobiota bacterium]